MSAELDCFRLEVSEALHCMAAVEERLARFADPADVVSVSWAHDHAAAALREAAGAVVEMGRE